MDAEVTTGTSKPRLRIRLASPRGFCAGVSRAIETVERAIEKFGAPVYVRHEIVHNSHVVRRLAAMGAVFVDEVEEAPADRPLVFSAHGSPASAYEDARARGIALIDAACPLVLKVHAQVRRFIAQGRHVLVVGHAGHPEVVGVMGQGRASSFTLVENIAAAREIAPPDAPLAYVTQTTLSVDDTRAIIDVLRARFPGLVGPRKDDICYATSNRQSAVKAIAEGADRIFVVGSATSSNSQRLVDVARANGVADARLVDDPEALDLADVAPNNVVGVTAGASAPEELVEILLARLAEKFALVIETVEAAHEDVSFKAPLLQAG